MKLFLIILTFAVTLGTAKSQCITSPVTDDEKILRDLCQEIQTADNRTNMLLTETGFNVIIQRRTFNYLTGTSELSLAKLYGTYASDNDKLTLGFNIPTNNPYTKKLTLVLNPIFEMDVKNNFATLFKDSVWKNNIRFGLKITYLPGFRRLKFYSKGPRVRKNDLIILRTNKFKEIATKLSNERKERISSITPVHTAPGPLSSINHDKNDLTTKEWKKKRKEIFEEFGKMEADFIDKELAYNRIRTMWFSIWGFTPLTKTEQYITPDATQPFTKTKFNLWELNFQANYLDDWRKYGSFYISTWVRHFQNNSAAASLMKNVDYQQYSQLPGTNPINLALLETNKGFIGSYKEFMTTSLNIQVLYFLPIYNKLIRPGVSIRIEKSWGDYFPLDMKFGIPLTILGKEKPVSVELQYRITDINNYKKVDGHETGKIFGLSLGFPFVVLYK